MKTFSITVRLPGWLALTVAIGCAEGTAWFEAGAYRYDARALTQWALPKALREISGLALDPADRLFAHDDEQAIVFELDYHSGKALKRFAVGDPPAGGDFEGIAWAAGQLYLVTSDGDLLVADEGADGGHVAYERYRTGLGKRCEIEGLDYDADRRLLLMPCKTPRDPLLDERLSVLAWSLDTRRAAPEQDLLTPWRVGARAVSPFELSALTRSPANGHLILLAARQHALLEVAATGELVRAFAMPEARRHPQMEGVAMTSAGDLIIADEGAGRRGRLCVYAAHR